MDTVRMVFHPGGFPITVYHKTILKGKNADVGLIAITVRDWLKTDDKLRYIPTSY